MARAELGTKRTCKSCSTKFYDLNKDPILCPECKAEFEIIVPGAMNVSSEEPGADKSGANVELVSLDKADAVLNDDVSLDDDDGIDIDADDDTTFLADDEDEDDGVSGLISGGKDDEDE